MMTASNFEFKYRFWLFGALFGTSFSSYSFDHEAAGIALAEWIARLPGTAATNLDYHLVFALGATLCIAAAASGFGHRLRHHLELGYLSRSTGLRLRGLWDVSGGNQAAAQAIGCKR